MTDTFDYDEIWREEKPFADRLAYWIKNRLHPEKVLDVGCGPGMHVYSLRDQNVIAWGYDIDSRVKNQPYLRQVSMFDIEDQGDVVLCIEVAEHLETHLNADIVQAIRRCLTPRGILIWTAAIPGQGGVGHINCQPQQYWHNMFVQAGLLPLSDLRQELLHWITQGYHMGWFTQNLQIFMRLDKD